MSNQQPKITHVFVQVYYAVGAPTFAEFRPNEEGQPIQLELIRHVDHQDIPVHPSDIRTSISDVEHTLVIKHIGTGTLRTEGVGVPIRYSEE